MIQEALNGPLAAMVKYRQFIVYKLVPSQVRPGKTDKFPCDFRDGRVVSAHDPAYWTDAWTALAAATNFGVGYGLAFVFTEADDLWFIDVDNCLQDDNTWSPIAVALCGMFQGAAVEVSQSGRGLHIFGSGRAPAHGTKNIPLGLEFYTKLRFVALTGTSAAGNAAADFTHLLPGLVAQYFPPDAAQALEQGWTEGPAAEWRGPTDDDELLRRALRSQSTASAFGGRASFADLWTGNIEALARCYPDPVRGYDSSSADAALAQHLAFWTGRDCERMQRIMQKSALVRDKWEREDYLPRTILGAVGRQFEVLTDKAPEPVVGTPDSPAPSATNEPPRPTMVTGSTFVNNDEQLRLFAGCVYIQDLHRVLIPGGVMLKPEQFKVAYGGYTFTMDAANEKTTRDAWEAFTQSQAYRCPRANAPCFKPDQPPGALIQRGGQTFVNTYWPVDVPRVAGDGTPFLNHLQKVLPDERDRFILLCYMAACVQHKGVKFQWAPLLQGVEGNGKTLFTRCVAEAVGRRYVHWPKASKLSKEFNAWMLGKLFYGVEDIYVPDQKREIIEELKPMITGGDGLEIEGKGVDQISADVCGNFMFNSNHKDAVRKTQNDRRFCVLFSGQQQSEDLKRDGMDGEYFPKLYDWLRADGYAIVSDLLHTFPIPDEYNPATHCQRAPVTTSTAAAISASTGGVEQELQEAIAQGLPGFCGGWISSIQLDRLLEKLGVARRVTHSKRKEMLEALGYAYHPALVEGRVNNLVLPDGGKPRLFVKNDSPARAITGAAEAAKAYEQANNHNRVPFPLAPAHT
jgi:hypothetical protein